MPESRPTLRWGWLSLSLIGLVCGFVFFLYTQPEMMVTLAEQLWACF
ncbi:MAG: hypothetical protein RIT26_94 [Pseudomonadota bacterium]|jgi:hypothetical protein